MRLFDQPLPTVGGPRPTAGWQQNLFITLGRLPIASYQWDDFEASWDDPEDRYSWDDLDNWPYDRLDVTCDWQGLDITYATADPEGRVEAAQVDLTLDNRSGAYSQYDNVGRLVGFGPGTPIDIWAVIDGEPWWLFRGRVTRWQEGPHKTAELTAFDRFSDLNEDPGLEWNPGTYGDIPSERIGKILDLFGDTGIRRFDVGKVTLHSFVTEATPLEEIQSVAISDGGLFFIDADGTIVFRDRDWRAGRDDQDEVRIFSDNVCEGATVVWDPILLTDDDAIINIVDLANVAKVTATARNPASINQYGHQTLPSRDKDQWITQAEGTELANYIVDVRSEGYLRIEGFTLYVHTGLWLQAIDMRLGDRVQFVRDQQGTTGPARFNLLAIVRGIHHAITPNGWITTFATSRAVGDLVTYRWDAGDWLTWDAEVPYNWDADPPLVGGS